MGFAFLAREPAVGFTPDRLVPISSGRGVLAAKAKPVPVNQNDQCQRATQEGCDCPCNGMLHQRDVLVAALESRKTLREFDVELTKLFGSPFSLLSTDPAGSGPGGAAEVTRREWIPVATASKQRRTSQVEQRAVDTALREVLRAVHVLSPSIKVGWKSLADDLTAKNSWQQVATQVQTAAGGHDEASGYFWASMLAATMSALATRTTMPTGSDILNYQKGTTLVFDQARYPRAATGNTVKVIREMRSLPAKRVAAEVIAKALAANSLPRREMMTVVSIVGSVVSADLWKHPCGVHHLLVPAIRILRRDHGASFSLDTPARDTAKILTQVLGDEWRARGAW